MAALQLVVLTASLLPLRSHDDDDIGRLATGWSVTEATDDAGLFDDSGWSDDMRRSDDAGFSTASKNDGGLVSTGEASGFTDSWTGKDGGLDVGRGGVLASSAFWLAATSTQRSVHWQQKQQQLRYISTE